MRLHTVRKRARGATLASAVALALANAGCPDTSVVGPFDAGDGADAGQAGKLELLQTIDTAPAGSFYLPRGLLIGPDDAHVYVTTWQGALATFPRGADGSLSPTPAYTDPVVHAWGLAALTLPTGDHLYAASGDATALHHYVIDETTGRPVAQNQVTINEGADEIALAAQGSVLVAGSGATTLKSYLVDPETGALSLGPEKYHQSQGYSFTILAHPDEPAIFVPRPNDNGEYVLVRYGVDATTGTLTEQGEAAADLAGGLTRSAMCKGTTRLYVPQRAVNIGYADVGGTGIKMTGHFEHPDLFNALSISLSPDCKNAYVVAGFDPNHVLVTLARAPSGDLTWLQTIRIGPNTSLSGMPAPVVARTTRDGKNVYLFSSGLDQAIAVFRRN